MARPRVSRVQLLVFVGAVAAAAVLPEGIRFLRENESVPVIAGIDPSYDGIYAGHAGYRALLEEAPQIRARVLAQLGEHLGLQVKHPDRIVIRFADGLRPNQPVAVRQDQYLNGQRAEVVTIFLEPVLLGIVNFEQTLTHELIHATMRERMGPRYDRLPRWVREGIATWGAAQLEEKTSVLLGGWLFADLDPRALVNGLETVPHTGDDYLEDVTFRQI